MLASRKPRLVVVALHRLGHLSKIQPCHVERCFRFLAAHFTVVRPSELDLMKRERRIAVVTIDDGHADAYRCIFPIAKTIGLPISVCIPTDFFFRRKWLWFDQFDWVMHHAKPAATATIEGFQVSVEEASSVAKFRSYLKRCLPAARDSAIQQLSYCWDLELPSSPPEQCRALTVPELQQMLSSGLVEVVGHTATHTIATVLSEGDFENELRQSKDEWESFCGRPIMSFCYPNGGPGDFDRRTAMTIKRVGYRYAFTLLEGTNLVQTMDPLEIKRVHIHWRPGVCYKLISGMADLQNSLSHSNAAETNASRHSLH
jgi:peptidoglycan/xylan/chitin deacetylase (PgdA/CDA1 family)